MEMNLERIGIIVICIYVGKYGESDVGVPPYMSHYYLRDAFKFELEEEDMERLWEILGRSRRWDKDEDDYEE